MQKNLKDLLIDELHDVLSAEEQIIKALPKMAQAAEASDLKQAFNSHLKETKGQVQRLKKIFKIIKIEKKPKFCKAMRGLIQEGDEVLKDFKTKSPVRDAALISKAQRIEHYEISAYGTLRAFAKDLGLNAAVELLEETLEEEEAADALLTKVAQGGLFKSGVNELANVPSPMNKRPKVYSLKQAAKKIVKKTPKNAKTVSKGKRSK